MIGRRHDDTIKLFHLLEHFPIILEALCLGILLKNRTSIVLVNITERNDIFAAQFLQVMPSLATNADAREIQFFVRGFAAAKPEHVAGEDHWSSCSQEAGAQELSARV